MRSFVPFILGAFSTGAKTLGFDIFGTQRRRGYPSLCVRFSFWGIFNAVFGGHYHEAAFISWPVLRIIGAGKANETLVNFGFETVIDALTTKNVTSSKLR